MANCKTCRREIEESAGRAQFGREAEAHLAACGACRDFMKERAALVGLVGGLGRVAAPDDFDVRLRARMASRRDGGRGHFFGLNFALAPGLAAAAAFVFVFGLAAVLYNGRGPSATQPVARREQPAESAPAPAAAPSPSGPVEVENASLKPEVKKGAAMTRPAVARQPRGRELSRKESAKPAARETREFVFRAAPVVIPAATSSDSMRVVLRNEDGSPRVVPVRSVSFGAQELIASGQAGTRPAAKRKEGVW